MLNTTTASKKLFITKSISIAILFFLMSCEKDILTTSNNNQNDNSQKKNNIQKVVATGDWNLGLTDQSIAQWSYYENSIYIPGSSPYSGRSTKTDRVDNWLSAGNYYRMNVKYLSIGNYGQRAEVRQLPSECFGYSDNKQINYFWDYTFDCINMWDKTRDGGINTQGVIIGQVFYNDASARFPYMHGGGWTIGKTGISYAHIKRTGENSGTYVNGSSVLTCDELKNANQNGYHVNLFVSVFYSTVNGWVTATGEIWNGSSYIVSRTVTLYTNTPNWWIDYNEMPYWKGGLYGPRFTNATVNDEWKLRIYAGSSVD